MEGALPSGTPVIIAYYRPQPLHQMLLSPHHIRPSIHQTITHLASLIVLEGLLPRVTKSRVSAFSSPPLLSTEPRALLRSSARARRRPDP